MSFHDDTPEDFAARLARKKRMQAQARHRRPRPPVKRANPRPSEDPIEMGYEVEYDFKSADEDRL